MGTDCMQRQLYHKSQDIYFLALWHTHSSALYAPPFLQEIISEQILWLELTMWLMLLHSGLNWKILSVRDDVKSEIWLQIVLYRDTHHKKNSTVKLLSLFFSGWYCFAYFLGSSSNYTIQSFSKNSHCSLESFASPASAGPTRKHSADIALCTS